jgi:hypothetical protein
VRLGDRKPRHNTGPKDRTLPEAMREVVKTQTLARGVTRVIREIGIDHTSYYAAMKGEMITGAVYLDFERFVLEHRVTVHPVEGPELKSELSMKARDILLEAIRQASGDEDE